jgi:predicted O-linked N-acetylglucosamine transferase (SPINDLY family)
MRQAARAADIDPDRLIFAAKADAKTHFGRLALADLYLDTFIYGAHTTASDALSVGVPVVTLLGGTFARRVAASLLTRTGLTELITQSPEQYEDLAVALAEDPVRLEALKKKVRLNSPPLFDAARFARYLEAAYLRMWERHEAGEKPESFAVEA